MVEDAVDESSQRRYQYQYQMAIFSVGNNMVVLSDGNGSGKGNSSGDVDPWLKVGRHHGGGSGSKEDVYNKRRLEGYFEMHFKRN